VKRLIALIIALAVVVAVAAFAVDDNAATVGGTAITTNQLNDQVTAVAGDPAVLCLLGGQATSVEGAGGQGTVSMTFVDAWLQRMITATALRRLAGAEGISLTADDLSFGRTAFTQQVSQGVQQGCAGQATAAQAEAGIPASVRQAQVQLLALESAIEAHLAGAGLGLADIARYLAAHPGRFKQVCFRQIPSPSGADASAISAAINAGTSPAAAAPAHQGVLEGSPVCTAAGPDPETQSLAQALAGVTPGRATQPLTLTLTSGEQVPVVLVLESSRPASAAQAAAGVRLLVTQAGATKLSRALARQTRNSSVWVNPQYGRWSPAAASVVPPTSPCRVDVPNPAANAPAQGPASATSLSCALRSLRSTSGSR
jgi:hypothetical protein